MPTSGYADRIRIGIVNPGRGDYSDFGPVPYHLSNLTPVFFPSEGEVVTHFLFRALYRLDSILTPVPDLAAAPCEATTDGLTVTCTLLPAKFADGSPLTADDVKFTYDLARSPACPFGNSIGCPGDPEDPLITAVEVLDPATVQFTLSRLDPTFITTILPGVFIESKALVESQFESFRAAAASVGSDRLRQEADSTQMALEANDEAGCKALEAEVEGVARSAGIELPDQLVFKVGPDGTLNPSDSQLAAMSAACGWLNGVRDTLYQAADSLDTNGVDAIAIAYGILPLQWHPVGSGLWRLDESHSVPGDHLVLVASPTADPQPATPRIEVKMYPTRQEEIDALGVGDIDWVNMSWDETINVSAVPGISVGRFAHPLSWTEIDFNVRPGQLFSDLNLRKALSLCIDRPDAVAAVTHDNGAPAAGIFAPEFWAADPTLTVPKRDVATAKGMIEASGWQLNGSVYEKDGERLAADIWTREEFTDRVKLAQLIATEAADCGMDLTVKLGTGRTLLFGLPGDPPPISRWPDHPAGSRKPFDMFLIGSVSGHNPDPSQQVECFHTSLINSADDPDACNYYGYSNPAFDALIEQAASTLDVPRRANHYRQALDILDHDLPQLPLYYPLDRVALRDGLTSLAGPLQLNRPGWWWQLESLVLQTGDQ